MKFHIKICFSNGYDTEKNAKGCNRYAKQNIFPIYLILMLLFLSAGSNTCEVMKGNTYRFLIEKLKITLNLP